MLVIRLGEALATVQDRVQSEYDLRASLHDDRQVMLATHDAPVAAVGNLSKPVQILREQLEQALLDSLTELLSLEAGAGADFVLDVFVILNLGEPLVANATMVIVDMLTGIVDEHFRAIFPTHRTAGERRFRVVPIAILPAANDCEKDRSDAIAELRSLHDAFVQRREDEEQPFFVDRVFLLDALTARGIADIEDLVDQVLCFLRLSIFGGVRRHPDFVQLLEADHNDLFGSFAVACCEVDHAAVAAVLSRRYENALAVALGRRCAAEIPEVAQLLEVHVLDDPKALERAHAELERLPLRTLEADGCGSVWALLERYDELLDRTTRWRDRASDSSKELSPTPAGSGGGALLAGLGGGTTFGAIVAAVVHFVAVASATVVAAVGGAFGLFAGLAIWWALRRRDEPDIATKPESQPEADPQRRIAILDGLDHAIDGQRTRLRALAQTLESFADHREEANPATLERGSTFRTPLVTAELLSALYERRISSDLVAQANEWLLSVASWEGLLGGTARPEPADLAEYCAAKLAHAVPEQLLTDIAAREAVAETLGGFVKTWRGGLGIFLEGESRKQFDPDGFDFAFSHAVFSTSALRPALDGFIREHGAVLALHPATLLIDDVFALTAITDIHPDAVSPLADGAPT